MQLNTALAARVGSNVEDIAFYRLVLEAMMGMRLAALLPSSRQMGHEDDVIMLLKQLSRTRTKR